MVGLLAPCCTSGIELTILLLPQMYSGMLVAYGILLGVLLISIRCYRKEPIDIVIIITAIMVVAISRFRMHLFLPILPGFLLVVAYGWKRTSQRVYLVAAGLAVALSLLIYLEMLSPIYLSGSVSIKLGINNLTNPEDTSNVINSWPFSTNIYNLLSRLIHNSTVLKWVWQIVSISAFVALNMIGIPLIILTSIFISNKPARQEFLLFTNLIVSMTVVSTIGAMCLTTDYDNYSLAQEMLYPTRWYLFLLMIPGLYYVYQFFKPYLSLNRPTQISLVIAFVLISLAAKQLAKPSFLMNYLYYEEPAIINASERMAMAYLHDNTPQNSIILTDKYVDESVFLLTSITGRAAYLEKTYDEINKLILKAYPSDNRKQVIKDLWATSEVEQFCRVLTTTPATHVIEYSNHPLLVNNPPCMQSIWESSKKVIPTSSEKVTIWKINR